MTKFINRRGLLGTASAGVALSLCAVRSVRAEETAKPVPPMPSIETYARTRRVDQIALSPDGKRVAIVSQKGDDKVLIHFAIADPASKSIFLGPSKVRQLLWGDNDHIVLVESTTTALPKFAGYRHEFSQARVINLNTGKVRTLFSGKDGFYNIILGDVRRIKVDGEYRVVASNYHFSNGMQTFGPAQHVYSFGLEDDIGHLMYEGPSEAQTWLVRPDGLVAAYSEFNDERKEWILYANTAPLGKPCQFKIVYRTNDTATLPELVGLGRDSQSVVLRLGADADDSQFHEVSLAGTVSAPLGNSGADRALEALFHPATGQLAGFRRGDDAAVYDYFDPLLKKLADALPQVLDEGDRAAISLMADDPRRMVIYAESAKDAGTYFFVDFSTGDLQLVASNYPDLDEAWITQKQTVTYKARDGLDIHGFLTLPSRAAAKDLPLVVLVHGGPHARDRVDFDWQVQALASRGYAVLQPNFRGSTGYGETFLHAGDSEWGGKMQTDLSDGVRDLAAKGIVDPKRVAIMGASYGGYAALAGATLDASVYRCAVAIAGPSDIGAMLQYELQNVGNDGYSLLIKSWRQMWGDARQYDDISPARQAAKAYCPILLIHGTDDTVVPIDQSQRMEKALKAAGKPVDFITYKGQDHWEDMGSARVAMMQAGIDFLMKHNPA